MDFELGGSKRREKWEEGWKHSCSMAAVFQLLFFSQNNNETHCGSCSVVLWGWSCDRVGRGGVFSGGSFFFKFYYYSYFLLPQVSKLNMTPTRRVDGRILVNNNTPNIWLCPVHTYSLNRFMNLFLKASAPPPHNHNPLSFLSFSLFLYIEL